MASGTLRGCLQLSQDEVCGLEPRPNNKEIELFWLMVLVAGLKPDQVCVVCVHVSHPSDVFEGDLEESQSSAGRQDDHLVPRGQF